MGVIEKLAGVGILKFIESPEGTTESNDSPSLESQNGGFFDGLNLRGDYCISDDLSIMRMKALLQRLPDLPGRRRGLFSTDQPRR